MRRALGAVVVVVVLAFGGWRWVRATSRVSEAEARALLDRLVAAAQKDGFGAGYLLVVEGRTSCGSRYHTQVLAVREEGKVRAVNGVFWSNAFVSRTHDTSPTMGEPPPRCP
jgi:hypothetical protein